MVRRLADARTDGETDQGRRRLRWTPDDAVSHRQAPMAPRRGACSHTHLAHGMIDFDVLVAADERGGIGNKGQLPWQLRGDLTHFRALTVGARPAEPTEHPTQNAVLMGRKTWDSLAVGRRPLPGRLNVVVTRNHSLTLPDGVLRGTNLRDALARLSTLHTSGVVAEVFVIGGGEIYTQALAMPECCRVHLTRVMGRFDCDVFLPPLGVQFARISVSPPRDEKGLTYRFEVYERVACASQA